MQTGSASYGAQHNYGVPHNYGAPHNEVPQDLSTTQERQKLKVLGIAGSLRVASFHKILIKHAGSVVREMGADFKSLNLKKLDLPIYNEDDEAATGLHPGAVQLKAAIRESDLIILATPNHNRNVPAVLLNALAWVSREGDCERHQESLLGKKFIVIGATGFESFVLQSLHRAIHSLYGEVLNAKFEGAIDVDNKILDANPDIPYRVVMDKNSTFKNESKLYEQIDRVKTGQLKGKELQILQESGDKDKLINELATKMNKDIIKRLTSLLQTKLS